jgi:hypothetical protein
MIGSTRQHPPRVHDDALPHTMLADVLTPVHELVQAPLPQIRLVSPETQDCVSEHVSEHAVDPPHRIGVSRHACTPVHSTSHANPMGHTTVPSQAWVPLHETVQATPGGHVMPPSH